ncbi:hypothetical protein KPH14_004853 [Odynerus spinipes]|uniref:Coiled-coil domain-containing protein 112 n=1 Tax=Odynerus spinipes TaxID=1348599 RepID=A0AAD9RMN4_9HYME|nr:hypothetical protein KPH14_004853 [Odynerus spinipes]
MDVQDKSVDNAEGNKRNAALRNVKKSEFLKTLMKLKQQEYVLEKGLADSIDNMKIDANIIKSLSREEKQLSAKRESVLSALKRTIFDINNNLNMAKLIISDPEKIQTLDINEFKSKLIELSKRLDDFKKTCPLQTLIEEGSKLDSEVKEFAWCLDRYSTVNTEIKSSMVDVSSFDKEKKKECEDYEEVQDFYALVAKTGHTQNWSNEDHLFFLKMRKKCNKNVPALVHAIQTKCPDLSAETVINHEAWYKLYLDLRERQKSKVKEWRKRKEMDTMKKLQDKKTIDKENLHDNIPVSAPEQNAVTKKIEKSSINVDQNDNKKELIKKWKLEKESKRAMDEEQSKLRLESKRTIEEKRAKIRMEKMQDTLRDYKNKKLSKESLINSKEELKSTKRYDPTLIKEFRKQDEQYVRKRKVLLSRTSKANKFTTIKKSQKISNYSTLFKPTKAWREKCKIEDSKMKDNQQLRYIKDIPKLHTRWRNEESRDLQSYFAS